MATLENKPIRATISAVIRYNNNPDKNLPPDGLSIAAAYIRGEHSVERLYSRGHNGCSTNPDVALRQFRACEALYRARKAGARESGLAEGKTPIVAQHFFLSFPTEESVSYETQCEIADKLCSSEILKDFYALSNRHYNTDNDHTHILISNFAKDGSRKLSYNNTKRKELRKELDRICALEYGLSVIDDPALRYGDPERERFIRRLVDEGKVNVYAPVDFKEKCTGSEYDRWMLRMIEEGRVKVAQGKSKNRKGLDQSDAYRRWIAEQKNFKRAKDKKTAQTMKRAALIRKEDEKMARVYYWDERFKSSRYPDYYYAVRLYDDEGHRKPLMLLVIELMLVAMGYEYMLFHELHPDAPNEKFFASTNWELQRGYDAMHFQEKQGVRTPAELANRISYIGTELSEVRQGKAYYTRALELDPNSYYAKRKVEDLTAQEERMKNDYRELKFIEKNNEMFKAGIEYYVFQNEGPHSLDALLNRANTLGKESREKSQKSLDK